MPHLPNEILDKIWLEHCKLGFEPRIVQAKWVHDGRFYVPKFYGAQPQEPITQLCRGARNVAAWYGFYSRILDDPFNGVGGFWWGEKDVLFVDKNFFERLRADRNSIFMGRNYITRVGIDLEVEATTDTIAKVLLDWFPMLSQTFFMAPARLIPVSQLKQLERQTRNRGSKAGGARGRWFVLGHESEHTKSLPITTFYKVGGIRECIPPHLFPRVQGITEGFNALGPPGRRPALVNGCRLDFIIFERKDEPNASNARDSTPKYELPPELKMTLEEAEKCVAEQTKKNLATLRAWMDR